ncbi:transposase [Micrococcus antarcticus]
MPTPKNTYNDQFKADAANLYESQQDLGYTEAAQDLDIAGGTLKTWVRQVRIKRMFVTKQLVSRSPAPQVIENSIFWRGEHFGWSPSKVPSTGVFAGAAYENPKSLRIRSAENRLSQPLKCPV